MDSRRSYFLLILLIGTSVLAFFLFRPFLKAVALAAIFAVVLAPLQTRIQKRMPKHPGLTAFFSLLLGCLMVLVPLFLVGTLVFSEVRQAYSASISGNSISASDTLVSAAEWVEPYFPGATQTARNVSAETNVYIQRFLGAVLAQAGSVFTFVGSFLLHLFVFLIALFYFFRNGPYLRQLLVKNSPLKDGETSFIFEKLANTAQSVVKGSLLIACIQGVLAGTGYAIFGVPNAALWGAVTALSALIPGIGTSLVLVPAILYLIIVHNFFGAVGLALWSVFLVGLIDNFLSPRIMGRSAELHPLVMLLAILGGLALYGPIGIFLGPLTASLLFAVYAIYSKEAGNQSTPA